MPGTTAFAATPDDLSAYGYVEEEYYVTGTANRYRIVDPLRDAQLVDGGHPYKTRMIIRRPADPAKFNGTLAAEWYNVTTGQDIDFDWATSHEYLMRNGYAAVSLSAQLVGVDRLKTWSPARYGDLSLTAPNTDPAGGVLDARGDVLGWDVFSQTVQALRDGALPSLAVKRVIANGESQSAGRLTTYYNSIDPLHRVIDGVVYYDRGGPWRADSPTKAISVATEFGSRTGPTYPDSAEPPALGGGRDLAREPARHALRRRHHRARQGPARAGDADRADHGLRLRAAVEHGPDAPGAQRRLRPRQPLGPGLPRPAERGADGARHDGHAAGAAARRGQPRARRHPAGRVHAPDGVHARRAEHRPGFCYLAGHHRFYTAAELAPLYPDPHAYVRGVVDTTAANLAAGYILGADASETVDCRLPRLRSRHGDRARRRDGAGDAVADGRPGLVRRVHAGRRAGVHGLDDRDRGLQRR